jgi:triacylglycerol lipase
MTSPSSGPRATRRAALLGAAAAALAPAAARAAERGRPPLPVVFVHGNGDTQALWITTIWRFESNGYPRDRLFAIDLRNPSASAVHDVPLPGRSTADDVRDQLAAFVRDVLRRTGADEVALVGNSRGGLTIRNYLETGGGAEVTAKAVLGGAPNHGVIVSEVILPNNEFNGAGDFLEGLNAGPNEVVPGVDFLTLRSDRFDKFAQPDGRYLGLPGVPTGVTFAGPELDGAANVVLPGVDHRETSYAPQAFARTYRFVTGRAPRTLDIRAERRPVLSGRVTGVTAGAYDNVGVAGARLEIFATDRRTGARLGPAAYAVTTGATGAWGPFRADPGTRYEFVLSVPGFPVTHIYRSPFPRSSSVVTLRPAMAADASATEGTVTLVRPRGYLGVDDTVLVDGERPAGIPDDPVPSVDRVTLRFPPSPERAVRTRFGRERITVRTPAAGEVAFAEFHD